MVVSFYLKFVKLDVKINKNPNRINELYHDKVSKEISLRQEMSLKEIPYEDVTSYQRMQFQ